MNTKTIDDLFKWNFYFLNVLMLLTALVFSRTFAVLIPVALVVVNFIAWRGWSRRRGGGSGGQAYIGEPATSVARGLPVSGIDRWDPARILAKIKAGEFLRASGR
jgi:hypothetical protein